MGICCTRGATRPDYVNTDRSAHKQSTIHCSTSESESKYDADDSTTDELDHRVNAADLGHFLHYRMTNKVLDRVWKHLDENNSGIERTDILNVLQWMAVLYMAYRYRV